MYYATCYTRFYFPIYANGIFIRLSYNPGGRLDVLLREKDSKTQRSHLDLNPRTTEYRDANQYRPTSRRNIDA